MTDLQQILLGTGLLTFSAIIHVTAVALSVPLFGKLAARLSEDRWPRFRIVALLALAVLVLVFAHTVQVWSWAVTFLAITALPDLSTSFYFATVTYTTLGYGDIVLGPHARIVATFCAITGLLTFGISTAFLIGVLTRILPDVFNNDQST
ncbi:potassium channel family protein [uncultured Tateyamaria sp.]|uniref:potassium channel family protein n=1 Tax=uncultured Tateyamaria sp. TaxID=455651 RepID=UPI00262BBE81|nr:potassium channel family protein [uncultured Tateyamaria sp.]